MSALWSKLRPHLLSWHMIPCLVMLAVAIGAAIVAGQPSRVFGAVVCMVTMMIMMSAMAATPMPTPTRNRAADQAITTHTATG